MGLTSRTVGGAVGPCDVVGVRVGLCIGGGGLLRAAARSTLGDGPVVGGEGLSRAAARSTLGDGLVVGTLGSGAADIRGRSTLGDGVMVVGGTGMFCWSDGSRMLRSCWMAWDRAMASLVEDGTVPPRAVSVVVAWMIVCSVSEISGMAQCVGYRRHVSATRYRRVPGM